MSDRFRCPACTAPVDRLQQSCGVVAAYPCNCWLRPGDTRRAVADWRQTATSDSGGER